MVRHHHLQTPMVQRQHSQPRLQTQTQARLPLACPWRPSAATTGHLGKSPPRALSHTRCAQPRNDSIKRAASTLTTPTAQTTEDILSIHCSWCSSTPLSPITSLLNTSFPQSSWTIRSTLSQTWHPQAQRSAPSCTTCLIVRPSTHAPGLRHQCAQPPPLQTQTAASPYIGVPHWGMHFPSTVAPHPHSQSSRRLPHHPPLGAGTLQRRRHRALTASSQALLPTPTPPLLHPQTTMQPSHSSTTIHLTHQTHWVIKNVNRPVPAPQTTQWPTHPCPCFLPKRSTSPRPLDCVRSEGECRGSGSWATWTSD